jgi:ABC-type antimicrobial peptide transport system permease subunit
LALAGVALGMACAVAAARATQALLYETAAVNPVSYAAAAVFVLLVAAAAAWLPAQRAAAISPMAALRED